MSNETKEGKTYQLEQALALPSWAEWAGHAIAIGLGVPMIELFAVPWALAVTSAVYSMVLVSAASAFYNKAVEYHNTLKVLQLAIEIDKTVPEEGTLSDNDGLTEEHDSEETPD